MLFKKPMATPTLPEQMEAVSRLLAAREILEHSARQTRLEADSHWQRFSAGALRSEGLGEHDALLATAERAEEKLSQHIQIHGATTALVEQQQQLRSAIDGEAYQQWRTQVSDVLRRQQRHMDELFLLNNEVYQLLSEGSQRWPDKTPKAGEQVGLPPDFSALYRSWKLCSIWFDPTIAEGDAEAALVERVRRDGFRPNQLLFVTV